MRTLLLLTGSCLLLFGSLYAQNRTITGQVADAKGVVLANISVIIKGTGRGTSTKADGSYTISVPASAKSLIFSSIGFTAYEVSIGNKSVLNVVLVSSADKDLQDAVVVGYGTQKRADITSSVSRVSGDKVANVPLSSVDQILQGKAAGVQSVTFSGQPGANQQVRIRGIGSYSASAQPLYVIDGIQINSGDLSRQTTTTNVLAQLNPDDIESISILKDAAGSSIYGARGANGVIVITTKRGKAGKTRFNVSGESGVVIHGDIPDAGKPLRSNDWLTLWKEGYANSLLAPSASGTPSTYTPATAAATALTTATKNYGTDSVDTDWMNLLLRRGTQQQYNVSASGGDAKTTFFISTGVFRQQASTIGSDLTRLSSVINLDHQVNNKLNFSFNLQPSYTKQQTMISNSSAFASPTMEFYFLRPTIAPFNPDGSYNIDRNSSKNFSGLFNPLYIVTHDQHNLNNFSTLGKASGTYAILPNLKFTSSIGLQYNNLEEYQYNNPLHGDGASSNGRGYAYYTRYFLYDWTNQLNYHTDLLPAKDLSLDATVAYEAISSRGYFISASAQNFPTPSLVDAINASSATAATNTGTDYNFASIISRASLGYKGKYILSGSVRRDGSSRFSPTHQYGNFPSISAAWNVSKEDFMDRASFVSDLKLRGSYGTSGNAETFNTSGALNNYPWQQTFGYTLNYNNIPGGGFNNVGNAQLQWERTSQADVGIDASFLKNRVSVIFDYYHKKSDQLLFLQPLSQTTGFTNFLRNIGAMKNTGVELTINATPVSTPNFTWDVSFNITHNKNQITKLPAGQTQIINGRFFEAPGHDIYEFYLTQWAGVDPATGNPQWYADSTKKTITTDYTKAQIVPTGKSASPKYYGGFSNTFTYKGFGISGDFYYNYGNYVQDQWANYLTDEVNAAYGKYSYTLNRWQKPGDKTNVPKLFSGSTNSQPKGVTNSSSVSSSTRFLYKGDYIRLRNVSISYTATPQLARKLHVSSLKAYVRGTNLWTKRYDKNIPFDPEQNVNSQSNLNVLYNKSITGGLNIGF